MEADYYDGRRRSEIVLSSDFECCHKYKHTLPEHVTLLGVSESLENMGSAIVKSKHTPSSVTLRTPSVVSSKSEGNSEIFNECSDPLEVSELVGEADYGLDEEICEEEEEYESSICSEWIVLKPIKKRRRKTAIFVDSSFSDLTGPAGNRSLLKRPPSPDPEILDEECRPKHLIPSNFFKYKDLEEWPEPPPINTALLKREPSPNMSLPKSREEQEVAGEDWLWFEGKYLESGDLEEHGEDEIHYKLPKQWIEGHWEPAPALLERWEREELELERKTQQEFEKSRKYEEIIKREDSLGMDIMNWGDGPVKLTAWMKNEGSKSLKELSGLLPISLSNLLIRVASEVPPEILEELRIRVEEAMLAEDSVQMIQQLLDAYIAKGLDVQESKGVTEDAVGECSNTDIGIFTSDGELKISPSTKSIRFLEEQSEAEPEETEVEEEEFIAEEQLGEAPEEEPVPIPRREEPCDPIPEDFRNTLLEFIQDFVADKPGDPLTYAIGYFQSRIPQIEEDASKSHSEELDATFAKSRRLAAFRARSDTSNNELVEEETEGYEKTPKETEILVKAINSCWMTKDLDLATIMALVKAMNLIHVEVNEEFQSSDVAPYIFYVIKRGTFKLQNQGGTKILKDRGFFGEISLNPMIAQSPQASFTATSLQRGALWCLRRRDFLRIKDIFEKNKTTILFSMLGVMELFDKLTEEEKKTVVDCLDVFYYKKRDIIFCQSSNPTGIYFFLNGTFKLIRIDQARGSRGSSGRTSFGGEYGNRRKYYHASTYNSPRLLGYGNFMESRPWKYSCVAKSNIVHVAILKTDVFERLYGDPEDVLNRPPPPPPRPKSLKTMFSKAEDGMVGETHGEYYGEYDGEEIGEEEAPPPPPPKVIPWLKKKIVQDPDEPPKPKPPPTYDEIMDAMWGIKPVYQHPKDSPCLCGQCNNTVTCVGQGMKCCDKPKVQLEAI